MRNKFLLFLLSCVLGACNNGFRNEKEFYQWWNNESNGLIKSKQLKDFKLTVKYMPAEYLAYNEVKNDIPNSNHVFDSLLNIYSNSRTFYLTIEPTDKVGSGNILLEGVKSIEEFKERVLKLNFSPGEFITLKTRDGEFKPVLSNMENLYNLDPKRSLYLVFADEHKQLLNAEELDFEFDDRIFLTGINHFVFTKKDLDHIPPFHFLKFTNL